jgi:hypothetical protein
LSEQKVRERQKAYRRGIIPTTVAKSLGSLTWHLD